MCDDQDLGIRITAEFREMPGLKITADQAARLFSLEPARCERILNVLVQRGLLWTDGREFARNDIGRRCA